MKQFIYEILISFGLFIILLFLFMSIFDYGNEGDMKGWINTWVCSIAFSSLGLYLIKGQDKTLIKIIKSIVITSFVLGEIYIVIIQLKVDIMFGGVILLFVPILLPAHKLLLEKFVPPRSG
ncbi:MAG: hypothetical protein ACJ04Q_06840 [Flavobacteriales bacterium]